MDKQTKEVEALLREAEEAFERGEIDRAIGLLTQARKLAPFRSDIGERLETLLESANPRPHCASQPSVAASGMSTEGAGQTLNGQALDASTLRSLPADVDSEEARGSYSPEEDEEVPLFRPYHSTGQQERGSSPKTQLVDATNELAEAEPSNQSNRSSRVPPSSTPPSANNRKFPPPGRSRREKAARGGQSSSAGGEDLFGNFSDFKHRVNWTAWLPDISPRAKAILVVYGIIISFVALSSIVTYQKFFSKTQSYPGAMVASQAAPSVKPLAAQAKNSGQQDNESLQILRLAKDYIRQRRFEEATQLLNNQLAKISEPTLKATYTEELARAYDLLGTSLLEKNKLLQSVSAYEKAVRLMPSSMVYLLHLANAHYYCGVLLQSEDSKRYLELAEQEVAKVVAQDPRNLDAYQLQASVRERLQNIDGALAALTKIIELAPPSSQEAMLAREKKNRLTQAH